MQFARIAAKQGIVGRRQLASWGFEHLRYRLRGTTDERTSDVLKVARELITRLAGADGRPDGPGSDGGDPAAGLPADAGRGLRPPGRRAADLHRQRRRQRRRRAARPRAGDGRRHRHPLRDRRRGRLHRPPRRALRLRRGQGDGDGGIRRPARDRAGRVLRLLRLALGPADAARGRQPGRRQPRPAAGARSPARRAGRPCTSSASAAGWSRSR